MIKEKKTTESITDKARLKTRKKYEKSFLFTAFLLCFYQIKCCIITSAANLIFSGKKQKTTGFLRFANKTVNKNICRCQTTAEKCEYYKNKIEALNAG